MNSNFACDWIYYSRTGIYVCIYVHNVCVASRQSQFPFNLKVQLPTTDAYLLYIFCHTRRMKFSWWYFGLTCRKLSLQLVFEFLCQITKILQLFAKERIFIMDASSWVRCIFEYTLQGILILGVPLIIFVVHIFLTLCSNRCDRRRCTDTHESI